MDQKQRDAAVAGLQTMFSTAVAGQAPGAGEIEAFVDNLIGAAAPGKSDHARAVEDVRQAAPATGVRVRPGPHAESGPHEGREDDGA